MARPYPFILLLGILILSIPAIAADPAPLTAGELTLRIVQSGTLYVDEPVAAAAIVLAVPQNTPEQIVQRFSIHPDTIAGELVKANGNVLLKLRWPNLQTGVYNYSVETVLNVSRRLIPQLRIGSDSSWLAETTHVQLADRIRELAWRYREASDLDDIAQLVLLAHSMLAYDSRSKPRTTYDILQTGSGDGLSHAIFLAALLRAADVPTRIVTGNAWIPDKGAFSNHAWTEVLAGDIGNVTWVPFDSALLRGGSASPAYVTKWAGLDLPPERLELIGGDAAWRVNPDRVEIVDSKAPATPTLSISPIDAGVTFPREVYGWFSADLLPKGCSFWHLEPISCINETGQAMLAFHDAKRTVWSCDALQLAWPFSITGANYVCPIRLEDATGTYAFGNATINEAAAIRNISIEGLETVSENEEFSLVALGIDPSRNFTFYSPTLNALSPGRVWPLQLKPGTYTFYLWSDGALAKKTVQVLEQRAFSIAISSPDSAAIDELTPIRIDVTNLLDVSTDAKIKLRADNIPTDFCWKGLNSVTMCAPEYMLTLAPGETRSLEFTVTLGMPGTTILTASAEDTSAAFVSKPIEVLMTPAKQLERLARAASKALAWFMRALASIPRMTLGI